MCTRNVGKLPSTGKSTVQINRLLRGKDRSASVRVSGSPAFRFVQSTAEACSAPGEWPVPMRNRVRRPD
ncbi:hypothetical protein VTK26DRAFT_5531 [Humicola hyalothermophila]